MWPPLPGPLHKDRVSLLETWLSPFSIWSCYVCLGKNVNRHFSLSFGNFCNKNNWLQCLVVFSIVILLFSAIRSLLSDLLLFDFPLVKKSKGLQTRFWSESCSKRKKDTESTPTAPIPPQNHSTGLGAPFQLNSKPNSSPQNTLQSSGYSSLWKRVIAWERSRDASGYGIIRGGRRSKQTRRNLVRNVIAWIVVVTARFKESYR